jgi:[ribosomal protein S5]-alanine N-acetyltransferase
MSDYFLTSQRLGFRTWRPEDIDLAVGLWTDPDVARFIHASGPPSPAAASERLAREIAMQAEHGVQYWPVFLLPEGAHAGCCGLRPYRPEQGILELGVHIRPAFWRKGLAFEAAKAVIACAFGQRGARGLFAGHNPANTASREMLLKLGFRYTHDELYPPTGLMHPSYLLTPEA